MRVFKNVVAQFIGPELDSGLMNQATTLSILP